MIFIPLLKARRKLEINEMINNYPDVLLNYVLQHKQG